MKKIFLLSIALCIASVGIAQKKELRNISKSLNKGALKEAQSQIQAFEHSISSAKPEQQAEFYLYKGQSYIRIPVFKKENFIAASEAFKKVIEIENESHSKPEYTTEAEKELVNIRVKLIELANKDLKASNFIDGSDKLYLSYTISPKDTSDLYYAAGYALNAKEYDTALNYYNKLLDLGYTGIKKQYVAIHKETGEKEYFDSDNERKMYILSGDYDESGVEKTVSNRPEILRNMALMYVIKEDNEKAKSIIDEARKANPEDIDLLRVDADLALKMKDYNKYNSLTKELIASDPDNPELYLELGNSAVEMDDQEQAIKYYKKALEINPDFYNANVNLGITILEGEQEIIEEMNSLGMTPAENKRYDELKELRKQMYLKALPYFEKAHEIQPENIQIVESLLNLYNQIGENEKFDKLEVKLQRLRLKGN